jgi:hypothetical protein
MLFCQSQLKPQAAHAMSMSVHTWQDKMTIIGEIEKQKTKSNNTKRQLKRQAVHVMTNTKGE